MGNPMSDFLAFIHTYPFYELTTLLVFAGVIGFLGLMLRQPVIVSFIAVGILVGPSAFGIVKSHEKIELLAELGVALLLFLVGLKLDLKLIRTLGAVSLATGLGQVLFTSVIGFGIGLVLGFNVLTSIYIGVALTFSSTIIIIKLLSDKKEVSSLHGKIAIGFLIVQDLVVVLAMMVLSAVGLKSNVAEDAGVGQLVRSMGFGFGLLLFVWIFIKYVATPLMRRVTRSTELIIIFAISWASLLAAIGNYLGFGKELGGLLAGISLASTPYRDGVVTRLSSLRDFLLLFFFITLGSKLDLSHLGAQVVPALIFSAFVLIGNPIIVMVIMGIMGYRKRTSFMAGLTVAQISEFSLVFVAMGLGLGHIQEDSLGLVTLVGLITIALSVYMITYSQVLYNWLGSALNIFERGKPFREMKAGQLDMHETSFDVILFGLGRYGSAIAKKLMEEGYKILGIDYNPEVIRDWHLKGCTVQYGDAHDQEYLHTLPLKSAKWVISAMPQHEIGITHEDPRFVLINGLKREGFQGKIAVSTHYPNEVQELKQKGADFVFRPFNDAAQKVLEEMEKAEP
jgi:Kef-type K+ transport system membrane component KefB